MIQLIAAVAAMYLVVGGAGLWMVRKQRVLRAAEANDVTNGGGQAHG